MTDMRATPWTPARVGWVVIAAYVVVAAGTIQLSSLHVRPLFEGIGPAAPYRWVKPPPELAAGNVEPESVTSEVTLGPSGSAMVAVGTSDAQSLLNLPEGAVPPKEGETAAVVTITPEDPGKLAKVPDGLAANGNAYRIAVAYKTSNEPVASLAKEGNVVLFLPHPGETILSSPDGRSWTRLDSQRVGSPTALGSSFTSSGYYLGGALPSALQGPTSDSGSDSKAGTIALVVGVIVLAGVLGGLPALRRRRRGPTTTARQRQRPPQRAQGARPPARRPPARNKRKKKRR